MNGLVVDISQTFLVTGGDCLTIQSPKENILYGPLYPFGVITKYVSV